MSNVMQRLREETAELHKHAESRPLEQALIGGTLPRELYVASLEQRFLVHCALERAARALSAQDARARAILDEGLFQEGNLRSDLAFFGVNPEQIQGLNATRRLIGDIEKTMSAAPLSILGTYYVFEGSKNGARYIARRLRPTYGLDRDGLRYFDPHGEQQRPLWEQFKQRMDAAGFSAAEIDGMVAAAQVTFQRISELDDELMGAAVATA